MLVATLAAGWQLPEWVDTASGWVTVGLLVTIGLINVWSLHTGQADTQGPTGVRSRYLRGLLAAQHPAAIFQTLDQDTSTAYCRPRSKRVEH